MYILLIEIFLLIQYSELQIDLGILGEEKKEGICKYVMWANSEL